MHDNFQDIANEKGWYFEYSRRDFANLYDEVENDMPCLFLDPVRSSDNFNEYGDIESTTHSGSFMLVLSSSLDEVDYSAHYTKYIKPLINTHSKTIINSLKCGTMTVESWEKVEVVNALDYNFSGLIITYSITDNG